MTQRINVLGVDFDNVTMDEAVDAAENMSKGVLSAFEDMNSDLSVGIPSDLYSTLSSRRLELITTSPRIRSWT